MPNVNVRIERLKAMLGLEEKRSALQGQLNALHEQLSALKDQLFDDAPSNSKPSGKPSGKATPARKGRSRRGALKEQILLALTTAGDAGVRVTELAAALGTKAANIHAWFHSTGKKVPGLSKVSGGHYKLKGGSPGPKAAAVTPKKSKAAKPASAKGKRAKRAAKGTKRGALSDSILKTLQAAGDKGITIKDLSKEVGANYRNVSVWFVTTGKKYPKVKKVGPAHYKMAA